MIGERLSEIRKDYGDKQLDLAQFLCVSLPTVRSWEQNKSSPSHEALVAICLRYHVSSDYLLGLSNVDPVFTRRRRSARFSEEELKDIRDFEDFLLWKKLRQTHL